MPAVALSNSMRNEFASTVARVTTAALSSSEVPIGGEAAIDIDKEATSSFEPPDFVPDWGGEDDGEPGESEMPSAAEIAGHRMLIIILVSGILGHRRSLWGRGRSVALPPSLGPTV